VTELAPEDWISDTLALVLLHDADPLPPIGRLRGQALLDYVRTNYPGYLVDEETARWHSTIRHQREWRPEET